MSAVASFALECAAAGRWARGMLALQPSLPSSDPRIRHAAIALAAVAAPHDPTAAAGLLLLGSYSVGDTALVGEALSALARQPAVNDDAFLALAAPLLGQAAATTTAGAIGGRGDEDDEGEPSPAGQLFLSATAWKGADTAATLAGPLAESDTACRSRLALLQRWRREDAAAYAFYFGSGSCSSGCGLPPSGVQLAANRQEAARRRAATRHHGPRDLRETARLQEARHRAAAASARAEEQRLLVGAFDRLPSWWSVAALLRLAVRPPSGEAVAGAAAEGSLLHLLDGEEEEGGDGDGISGGRGALCVSWRSALAILGDQPLLPEMELPYVRCIGLCAPQLWAEALERLGPLPPTATPTTAAEAIDPSGVTEGRRRARLWLASRGGPSAAAEMVRQYIQEAEEVEAQQGRAIASTAQDPSSSSPPKLTLLDQRRQWGEELLSRSHGLAPATFFALFPATGRPWCRLSPSAGTATTTTTTTAGGSVGRDALGGIARALARGVRLDEVQLSAAAKALAREGDWVAAVELYRRFPTPELQRHAVEALVAAVVASRGSSDESGGATRRKRHRKGTAEDAAPTVVVGGRALPTMVPPQSLAEVVRLAVRLPASASVASASRREETLGTHCAYVLVKAAADAVEAAELLRLCVRYGTRCNPQIMSAIMDAKPRREALAGLLASYPGAVNAGVSRRAREEFGIGVEPTATATATTGKTGHRSTRKSG